MRHGSSARGGNGLFVGPQPLTNRIISAITCLATNAISTDLDAGNTPIAPMAAASFADRWPTLAAARQRSAARARHAVATVRRARSPPSVEGRLSSNGRLCGWLAAERLPCFPRATRGMPHSGSRRVVFVSRMHGAFGKYYMHAASTTACTARARHSRSLYKHMTNDDNRDIQRSAVCMAPLLAQAPRTHD